MNNRQVKLWRGPADKGEGKWRVMIFSCKDEQWRCLTFIWSHRGKQFDVRQRSKYGESTLFKKLHDEVDNTTYTSIGWYRTRMLIIRSFFTSFRPVFFLQLYADMFKLSLDDVYFPLAFSNYSWSLNISKRREQFLLLKFLWSLGSWQYK